MTGQLDLRRAFRRPAREFGPVPFWFWNDELTEAEIARQIRAFARKGVAGFVLHPRMGLPREIPYLSDRFLAFVRFAVDEAARNGLQVVLYDEGMYPSGSAHGQVVAGNPEYAARGLRMREYAWAGSEAIAPEIEPGETVVAVLAVEKTAAGAIRPGSARLLDYSGGEIHFNRPLSGSVLVFVETHSRGTIRGIHFGEDDGEPGAPPAADLLNPAAMRKFIRLTHDRYYSALREHFGRTIRAFFTDEPDVLGRCAEPGLKPWTPGFLAFCRAEGLAAPDLAGLWFDVGPDTARIRKSFARVVRRRLEETYYRPISEWCGEHGIALTGHPAASDEIGLLKHFHLPGQDTVWRWVAPEEGKGLEGPHSTAAKCSADAARHAGGRRNASECFGCCGPPDAPWAFSAADMKWYLDWLFVRGVNLIIPHAFYYSLRGEARINERPPDVGPGNIWWRHYRTISTYIKRLSWLMTDSVNAASVAVLCEADRLPWAMVKPLYQNQIEFNYLEEDLVASDACRVEGGRLLIGPHGYRAIIVDDPGLLKKEVAAKLREFAAGGGRVIAIGLAGHFPPSYVHVVAADDEAAAAVRSFLPPDLRLHPANASLRASHVVKDGCHLYLLVNEGEEAVRGELELPAFGAVERWDAWSGRTEEAPCAWTDGRRLRLSLDLPRRESVIFCLDPARRPNLLENRDRAEAICAEGSLEGEWLVECPLWSSSVRRGLGSWTDWPGMAEYSGRVTYKIHFDLAGPYTRVELDLGAVGEIAEVRVNGKKAGFKLWAPFTFDLTRHAIPRRNELAVEVINSMANRYHKARLASGLLGPVRVRVYK